MFQQIVFVDYKFDTIEFLLIEKFVMSFRKYLQIFTLHQLSFYSR